MLSKTFVLVVLIGSGCLFLAGLIMMPIGAAGVCSRLAVTQAGVKQKCTRCSGNVCATCGGGSGTKLRCRCDSTELPNQCYTNYSHGAIALIVIGVLAMVAGIVGVILMFTWQKKATLVALGRKDAEVE